MEIARAHDGFYPNVLRYARVEHRYRRLWLANLALAEICLVFEVALARSQFLAAFGRGSKSFVPLGEQNTSAIRGFINFGIDVTANEQIFWKRLVTLESQFAPLRGSAPGRGGIEVSALVTVAII